MIYCLYIDLIYIFHVQSIFYLIKLIKKNSYKYKYNRYKYNIYTIYK